MTVELPDGTEAEFPDTMSEDEVKAVLRRKFPVGPQPSKAAKAAKTAGETAADFAQQFGSIGGLLMAPKAAMGALGSYLVPYTARPGATLGERFKNEMEQARRQQAEAYQRSPIAAPAGAIGSALAVPLPAPATQAAMAARAAPAALAAAGVHDTALFNAALAASRSAGQPGMGTEIAQAASSPLNLLGAAPVAAIEARNLLKGRALERMSRAEAKAGAKAAEVKGAEQASLVGKYGGLRQTENKAIREAAAMEAAGTISPQNAALLAKARQSGRFNEALNEALANDLAFLTTRVPEVQAAKQAMQEGAAGLPVAIQAETAAKLSPAEARSQLAARLKRYGPASLLGAGLGAAVGGPAGAVLGTYIGAGRHAPFIHSLRRAAQNPAVQYQTSRVVSGALGPSARLNLTPDETRALEFYMAQAIRGKGPRVQLELVPGAAEEGQD